jgi:hypothetical protein
MMTTPDVLFVATKSITLLFGSLITVLAYRAYVRTRSEALRALAVGFALVTVGSALGGVLHQLFGFPLAVGQNVQSAFVAAGFAVLTYSLYVTGPGDRDRRTETVGPPDSRDRSTR